MEQFEFWFKDDVRKQRAMEIQAEKQEFYEKFGAGTADEMIWSFPVIGK